MSLGVFNSSLFNKPIFNTKFIDPPGFTHIGREPKKKLLANAFIKISSSLTIHTVIYSESSISTNIQSQVISKISFNSFKEATSKILHEIYQPVNSIISKNESIPIKGRLNSVELSMNRVAKYNKIQGILALLDKIEDDNGKNYLHDDQDDIPTLPEKKRRSMKKIYD